MKYKPRQLHLQYQLPDSLTPFNILIKYDIKFKEWQFYSYVCIHCDTSLKHKTNALKHKDSCKRLNNKKKELSNADSNSDS
jgi:hypothetical protein